MWIESAFDLSMIISFIVNPKFCRTNNRGVAPMDDFVIKNVIYPVTLDVFLYIKY